MYTEGLHRKISHDIMEVWKRNIQPLYDKEMEDIKKKGGETCGDNTRSLSKNKHDEEISALN